MDLEIGGNWLEDSLLIRMFIVFCLTALALGIGAATARASITLGQVAPAAATGFCNGGLERLQPTVTGGAGYVAPGAGTVTSWSTRTGPNTGQEMTMHVFRKTADPSHYTVVAHDGPRSLTQSALNTFATSIPVRAGDVVGMESLAPGGNPTATYCDYPATGESYLYHSGALTDGGSADFTDSVPNERLNISAVFVPSSAFTIGATQRHKKSGTASLTVTLPGPGELTATGTGLTTSAPGGVPSTAVSGAGDVKVLIHATGAKKRRLRRTGKVRVGPTLTYTPTGGDPSNQSTSVLLKLKKRR